MSTLLRRDPRTMFPDLVEWFEEPFMTLRPYLAQPIRVEDYLDGDQYSSGRNWPGSTRRRTSKSRSAPDLTIHAERHEKIEGKHRSEFRYGAFTRSLAAATSTRTTSRRPTKMASSRSPSACRPRRRSPSRRSRSRRPPSRVSAEPGSARPDSRYGRPPSWPRAVAQRRNPSRRGPWSLAGGRYLS